MWSWSRCPTPFYLFQGHCHHKCVFRKLWLWPDSKNKVFLWKWWGRWLFCWPLGCLWCRRRWRLVLECWEEAHTWRSPGKSPTMKRTLSYLKVIVPYIIITTITIIIIIIITTGMHSRLVSPFVQTFSASAPASIWILIEHKMFQDKFSKLRWFWPLW